jgi:hypothetical protein
MSAALGMVLVAFGTVVCLACGALLVRRARRQPGIRLIVATTLVLGGAAFLIALLVSGLRHFGGEVQSGGYACAPWWSQIDSTAGLANDHVTPATDCRQAAIDAIDTVLTQCGLIALTWGGLVGGYLTVRRHAVSTEPGSPVDAPRPRADAAA